MDLRPASCRFSSRRNERLTPLRCTRLGIAISLFSLLLPGCGGGGSGSSTATDAGEASFEVVRPLPEALMRVSSESSNGSCVAGATRVQAGIDADGDGQLGDAEVHATALVCTDGSSASTLATLVFEGEGSACPTSGAQFQVGLDANGDGTLQAAETTTSVIICRSAATAPGTDPTWGHPTLMRIALEAAGDACPFGGDIVTSGRDANGNGVLDAGELEATMHVCSESTANPLPWFATADSAVQATANTGHVALSDTTQVVVSLPDTLQIGDIVAVAGRGAGGWRVAQAAGQSVNAAPVGAVAGLAWTPHESNRTWGGIATSSDGRKLVAADYSQAGRLHLSGDAGLTWTAQGDPLSWWGVASSSDGVRLAAAENAIQTSADSGTSWTARATPVTQSWSSIASSADGTRLAANSYGGQIHTSSDAGLTWTARASVQSWNAIASSANGNMLAAAGYGTRIHTSADGGMSWTEHESVRKWESVASSADGLRLAAVASGDRIFLSSDAGATWTAHESARTWLSIACSDDCSTLVAVADGGQIQLSTDSGATWIGRDTSRKWYWAASSADGSRLVAIESGGRIYTSSSWTTVGPLGALSGGADAAVELQYTGNGNFTILRHAGTIGVQ